LELLLSTVIHSWHLLVFILCVELLNVIKNINAHTGDWWYCFIHSLPQHYMEVSGLEAPTESVIMNRRLGWLQIWSRGSGEKKKILLLPGIKP
jgi:hypothetical protein